MVFQLRREILRPYVFPVMMKVEIIFFEGIQELETKELVCKIGNGSATKYAAKPEGTELLTQLQMVMDILQKSMISE